MIAGHPERPSAADPAKRAAEYAQYHNLYLNGLLGYGEEDREQLQGEYDALFGEQLRRARERGRAFGLQLCGWMTYGLGSFMDMIVGAATDSLLVESVGGIAVGVTGAYLIDRAATIRGEAKEGEQLLEWETSEAQMRLLSVDSEDMRGLWPADPEAGQAQGTESLKASMLGGLAGGAAAFVLQRALERKGGAAAYMAAGFATATGAAAAVAVLRNRPSA